MTAAQARTDRPRNRLASNHNETLVADRIDRGRKRLSSNDNERTVVDDFDSEAHRLASNDNEIAVEGATEDNPEVEDRESLATAGLSRRAR